MAATPEHQAIMDEQRRREVKRLLDEGLKLRALCSTVLSPKDAAEAVRADAELLQGDDGEVCSCAVARRTIIALDAEVHQQTRNMIAALYWRAGEAACVLQDATDAGLSITTLTQLAHSAADAVETAVAMDRCLPRAA